jgi:glycosyltransferase involved in cell wall biosynthesis
MSEKKLLLVDYRGITLNDPPFRNALECFLESGYDCTVLMSKNSRGLSLTAIPGVTVKYFDASISFLRNTPAYKVIAPALFLFYAKFLSKRNYSVIITVMLQPVAAISFKNNRSTIISSILDIPSPQMSGRIDAMFNEKGWNNLHYADVIWSSDHFKAKLVTERAKLKELPIVCHNCPRLNYLKDGCVEKDPYLYEMLLANGLSKDLKIRSVLLRAGAIGEYGGIEETLQAMTQLPENFIFVMMGRPEKNYKANLLNLVRELNLLDRVFLLDRIQDEEWKRILCGADIGHLVHIRPRDHSGHAEAYDLNSSLSNNRMFQYMAASLPIISYNDTRMAGIYEEVNCFRVVDQRNLVQDIKDAWLQLASNDDLRLEMGRNGRKAHLEKYNWEYQFGPVMQKLPETKSASAEQRASQAF